VKGSAVGDCTKTCRIHKIKSMKRQIALGAAMALATSLLGADARDDVKAAAKKLADASGYSWKATTEMGGGGGGGGRGGGPTEGMALKDGTICLKMTRGENTTEAFKKGDKGVVKTQEGWQSLAELAPPGGGGGGGGQGMPGRFMARTLQNYKAPADEAADMAGKVKELKKEGDAWVGAMTEEGAKSLMTFGRGGGGGGNAPEVSGAQGKVKFWVKDGVLAKYEYNVKGTVSMGGNDREVDRTTTVEIKDVGTTKLAVPDEVKKKLS